jgi:hypothetical protein
MKTSIRTCLIAPAAAALALCAVGSGTAATHTYKPFVTDFPKPVAAKQDFIPGVTDFGIARRAPGDTFTVGGTASAIPVAHRFIPGVTDFGIARRTPGGSFTVGAIASARPAGPDWGDVGAGAGIGIAFTSLVAAAALTIARRRNSSPLGRAAQPN